MVGDLAQTGDVGEVLGEVADDGAAKERGGLVVCHGVMVCLFLAFAAWDCWVKSADEMTVLRGKFNLPQLDLTW